MITAIDHGDGFLTMGQLSQLKMERPANAGSHWKGVSHNELIHTIIDEVEQRGWEITDQRVTVDKGGTGVAAAFGLSNTGISTPDGLTLAVGVLAANNMRRAIRLCAGANVMVCNNGLITGEVVMHKKHTINTDLADEVSRAFDAYVTKSNRLTELVARMRDTTLKNTDVAEVLAAAKTEELMGAGLLWEVAQEYLSPRHPEHGVGTAWGLLNAFTEIVKKTVPGQQMQRSNRFRELVMATVA